MAQKRMFSNDVISNDNFIEMPDSSQNLYFHLSMNADDDGFVSNYKSVMRMLGKKEDDLKVLFAKQFIIPFENGLLVIRHWRMNNYIQKDRYKETIFKDEKAQLSLDKNNVYNLDTDCIHSIDKISIEEISNITTTNISNIFNYIEENYGRMLSPIEYEKINSWLLLFSEDIIKYAIEIAVNNGKKTISYLDGILKNWKGHNYQSLEEIKENESKKDKPQKEVPEWFDKNIENEVNIEATKEMDNLLEKFN
jgi:DnaD/phage-associated family protein